MYYYAYYALFTLFIQKKNKKQTEKGQIFSFLYSVYNKKRIL